MLNSDEEQRRLVVCVQWITNAKSSSVPNNSLAQFSRQELTHPQQWIIVVVLFIIQFIYLHKQKKTKEKDTFVSFRFIYFFSFKTRASYCDIRRKDVCISQ